MMPNDLLNQLADYGSYHREQQAAVSPGITPPQTVAPDIMSSRFDSPLRRVAAALIAAALVMVIFLVPALLRAPAADERTDTAATVAPLELSDDSTAATNLPNVLPPEGETRPMVQMLADGSALALSQGNIWRSEDQGETWTEWYAMSHEIALLATAPDGAILAVRNHNAESEALGEGSTVNETPDVHRYDPTTDSWTVITLERPEMPISNPVPQEENIEECALYGLQSHLNAIALSVGPKVAIVGEHRVVADGICDQTFPVIWSTTNGIDWGLIPNIDVTGHVVGIVSIGSSFMAYGSPEPPHVGGGGPVPLIWTSSDLMTWVEQPLDLSVLPQGGFVESWAELTSGDDWLTLRYQVLRYRPGLDASIDDVEALRSWRLAAGLPESPTDDMTLEETLEVDGISFPLDDEEIEFLNRFYDVKEQIGVLRLTTRTGAEWDLRYSD